MWILTEASLSPVCTAGYVPSHAESAACFPRAPLALLLVTRHFLLGQGQVNFWEVLDSLTSCRPQLLQSPRAVCDFAPGSGRPEAAAQVNGGVG